MRSIKIKPALYAFFVFVLSFLERSFFIKALKVRQKNKRWDSLMLNVFIITVDDLCIDYVGYKKKNKIKP